MSVEVRDISPTTENNNEDEKANAGDDFVIFLGVHVGAGFHSEENAPLYKKAMKESLNVAYNHIKSNTAFSAVDAVEKAIEILENNPLTNAGLGSNLTIEGTVECDASLMDGKNAAWFGAVGAVEGIKNPIKVARKLLDQRRNGLLSLGRVPPLLLVGEGARKFGEMVGEAPAAKDELVTEKSKQAWQKYTSMLQTHNNNNNKDKENAEPNTAAEDEKLKQTKLSPATISAIQKTITPPSTPTNKNETEGEDAGREKRRRVEKTESKTKNHDLMLDTVGAVCLLWRKCTNCQLAADEISNFIYCALVFILIWSCSIYKYK